MLSESLLLYVFTSTPAYVYYTQSIFTLQHCLPHHLARIIPSLGHFTKLSIVHILLYCMEEFFPILL